jgi:hypothetical protein
MKNIESVQLLAEGQIAPGVTFAELEREHAGLVTTPPGESEAIVPLCIPTFTQCDCSFFLLHFAKLKKKHAATGRG